MPAGGGLVDDPQLHPHGGDAQSLLLGDGLVDDRADLLRVDEAVDDVDPLAVRHLGEPGVPGAPRTVSAFGWTGTIRIPSSALRNPAMEYAVLPRFVDSPTTAHVAGVISRSRTTTGSLSYLVIAPSWHP